MSPQRLGQNFLADAAWQQRILRALRFTPDQTWVEIGAGHGEITRELARAVRRVAAIELDARLVKALERLAGELPALEVFSGDVMKIDLAAAAAAERFRVCGNLPYYITSPILHRLFEWAEHIESIHIVIQLEVAARLTARPGRREYGYLSVATQFFSAPEIIFNIPPGAFRPRPKVASALVELRMGDAATEQRRLLDVGHTRAFLKFVQGCFAQKRKTLLNNLRAAGFAGSVESLLRSCGIPPKARAEELSVAEFADLYRAVRDQA